MTLAAKIVAFDVETYKFSPGLLAPPLVCASVAFPDPSDPLRSVGRLLSKEEARAVFRALLRGDYVIVGANLAYDVAVMLADAELYVGDYEELLELVFAAYEAGRIFDVLIAQALDAIAGGHFGVDPRTGDNLTDAEGKRMQKPRYNLANVTEMLLRRDAKARDFWRFRYAILDLVPVSEWPDDARQYPVDDSVNTRDDCLAQLGLIPQFVPHDWADHAVGHGNFATACRECGVDIVSAGSPDCVVTRVHRNLARMVEETRAALALHLGAVWGLRTDPGHVADLEGWANELHAAYSERFIAKGYLTDKDERGKPVLNKKTRQPDVKELGQVVKRDLALAYGADPNSKCPACGGAGKRPSPTTGKPVWCSPRSFEGVHCAGTGLDLETAPTLPRTDGGDVKTDRDTLSESGDEDLMGYGDDEYYKIRTTYIPFLQAGISAPMNLRPNVLVSSFRVSYGDTIQQMPRGGAARACVTARRAM